MTDGRSDAPAALGVACGAVAMVLVGGVVTVSGVLANAPFYTAEAARYAVACAALASLARLTGRPVRLPRGTEWVWLCGVACSGLVIFNVALVEGARHAEPAVLGVAVACAPPLLAVAGPLLEGTRPRAQAIMAAVVVTSGAVLVQGLGHADATGLACAAIVFACEAMFTLLAIPVLRRHGPWGVSAHTTWLAAVMFAILGAVHEGPSALARLDVHDWLATGYLAVVTVAAFVMWYSCVGRIGAGRAGLLAGVAPIAAALSGMLLGRPVPRPLVWVGMAVVVAGLAAGLLKREGKQRVFPAFRFDLARLSRARARGRVRRGHQPGGQRGRRGHEVLGEGANEPIGKRTAPDPGLAAHVRQPGAEADPVSLCVRGAAAPVPQGRQPAVAASARRSVQRDLARFRGADRGLRPGRDQR